MNHSIKNFLFLVLVIIAVFSSCYPGDNDLTVEDLDVAASIYDKNFYSPTSMPVENKFEDLQTFIVVDTVIHVVDESGTDEISRIYDQFILEQIQYNMLQNGFTNELAPGVRTYEIALTVTVMSSEHDVYYWYPYWGWFWGYGGYPYGSDPNYTSYWSNYYYPWSGYESYYTYKSGTVLIEMIDVARIDPEVEEIPVIWAGILNGILQDAETTTKNRLANGIDQCFEQSPYLLKQGN